jgi:hypothetical protein
MCCRHTAVSTRYLFPMWAENYIERILDNTSVSETHYSELLFLFCFKRALREVRTRVRFSGDLITCRATCLELQTRCYCKDIEPELHCCCTTIVGSIWQGLLQPDLRLGQSWRCKEQAEQHLPDPGSAAGGWTAPAVVSPWSEYLQPTLTPYQGE